MYTFTRPFSLFGMKRTLGLSEKRPSVGAETRQEIVASFFTIYIQHYVSNMKTDELESPFLKGNETMCADLKLRFCRGLELLA